MFTDNNGNKWYKGNLHTHTTQSDGRYTPDETIALYKTNGYDFIALTDHWSAAPMAEHDGILQIAGCEYDTGNHARHGIYHIVALGITDDIDLKRTDPKPPVQHIIDKINDNGGFAVLAHPAWSLNKPDDIAGLHGLSAVEIFNTVSDMPRNLRGHSGWIIDRLATDGHLLPCIAVDDTHFYDSDECKSFVYVKAEKLTQDAILTAIRNGDFIASQGPFFSYTITDDIVEVTCTEVETVVFMTDTVYTGDRVTSGHGITSAKYKIKPTDTFIRIELIDAFNKRAWSSPFKVR